MISYCICQDEKKRRKKAERPELDLRVRVSVGGSSSSSRPANSDRGGPIGGARRPSERDDTGIGGLRVHRRRHDGAVWVKIKPLARISDASFGLTTSQNGSPAFG